MVKDQIRYDILVQDALRGVIRKVLSEVAKAGLPGNHHFFITFFTNAPGVKISPRLKNRYPEQMTIVLQHQFRDLSVSETAFEVTLSFREITEKLVIPFTSIQVFYDPVATFEAAFDLPSPPPSVESEASENIPSTLTAPSNKQKKESMLTKKQSLTTNKEPSNNDTKQSADIVSLDSFRKK
ncbi:SspB family protein [Bartonella krasnovii]|uniref:ClpXP protease specificity-enhancing factor SspB n=1 Tax=Bartonella krasnovii TaxID=2267275 RepID=A0A5B9D1H2_9HYPH|nr:ClpXP protease specificity-enhancing factor SspB [Bartonella krasnovii]QEE12453.1 ClpXP protease specificity-enhancing factor sspbalpha [Bartonella krasnovii]UNF28548.1 ClpXP protease specificity-enhancing factor SspB [Bartonella krasnovii]UNF34926.1 ClpXP protease specificity-enhancing factor SspB [Bartonella krasnovii]UNF36563.1 ClpXP protease specificity-enhancing factor SspB [Bartonella krasnovii]UNF38196.1 ClpXP protease specificity-enhancing factor SspB [Bartonella krasnovii]